MPITPAAFRRDPCLRSSAYQLASWSAVVAALGLPAYHHATAAPWGNAWAALYVVGLAWFGFVAHAIHARRVAKMLGDAGSGSPGAVGVSAAGLPTAALAVYLAASGSVWLVQPVGMLAVGVGCIACSLRGAPGLYAVVGATALVVGVWTLVAEISQGGGAQWNVLYCAAVSVGALAASVAVNRRYLWLRS